MFVSLRLDQDQRINYGRAPEPGCGSVFDPSGLATGTRVSSPRSPPCAPGAAGACAKDGRANHLAWQAFLGNNAKDIET
jgi:hypothetical protein